MEETTHLAPANEQTQPSESPMAGETTPNENLEREAPQPSVTPKVDETLSQENLEKEVSQTPEPPMTSETASNENLEKEVSQTPEPPMKSETAPQETPESEQTQPDLDTLLASLEQKMDEDILPDKSEMDQLSALIHNHKFKSKPDTPDDSQQESEEEESDSENASEEEESAADQSTEDQLVARYIRIQTKYKELKAREQQALKAQMEENLTKKSALLDRMAALLTSAEDFGKIKQEFREIREEWKSIGDVPQNDKSEILRRYQKEMENFYEINAITNEFREYDFAKNKEEKERLIMEAQKLNDESDIIKAFNHLQQLHDEWRETGPVSPDIREDMWRQFKDASTLINKRHQDHFVALREQEKENLKAKEALCERLEALMADMPSTREGWRKHMEEIDRLKEEWRSIGFAPKKHNAEIYQRFRKSLNETYSQRRAFMKEARVDIEEKLVRMRELTARAKELVDSTDWKATTEEVIKLQEEWKSIGGLGVRVSEATRLWKEFSVACNTFFKNKHADYKERNAKRNENLRAKKALIERLKELKDAEGDISDDIEEIRDQWQQLGHVPNKHKDQINDEYYNTLRELQGASRKGASLGRRGHASFDKDLSSYSEDQMGEEYRKISRIVTRIEDEIKQYNNNLGFFRPTGTDKDNPLAKQVEDRIEKLTAELEKLKERQKEIRTKVSAGDSEGE